ncbi:MULTISPECIES: hypothetical protein [Pseudomonas]|uniref:hypothetical protein n=1 Tax=Pseudomonas TaxID=286 RepID=UPI0011B23337|nr:MULTISPECIES: hypothetical protein [Pseudomonas]MDM9556403.1 hypothetical protein [Pseudomonas asiatica]
MSRADRLQKMLSLIEERLGSYTVDETVERLRSYGGVGPTIDEYSEQFDSFDCIEDQLMALGDYEAYHAAPDDALSYHIAATQFLDNPLVIANALSCSAAADGWEMLHIPFEALDGSWAPLSTAFEVAAGYHMSFDANDHSYMTNSSNDKEAQEAA